MTTKLLLADDHEIVRQGLRELLATVPDMTVVGEADDGRLAVQLTKELRPDVILMDIEMPGLNGIEATRQIAKEVPRAKVLGLSMHSQCGFVSEMLKAGACGYLHKNCTLDEIVRGIHAALANQIYLTPAIAGAVVSDYMYCISHPREPVHPALTDREREVLRLVTEGASSKEIALQLRLSVKTVEGYRRQIMDKLDKHSLPELTKYAVLAGLTFLET